MPKRPRKKIIKFHNIYFTKLYMYNNCITKCSVSHNTMNGIQKKLFFFSLESVPKMQAGYYFDSVSIKVT